jgi:hypothetical protein
MSACFPNIFLISSLILFELYHSVHKYVLTSKFWELCKDTEIFITTRFLDFVHRPEFHKQGNTTFRKLDLFPSSGLSLLRLDIACGKVSFFEAFCLVGAPPPSHEDGNRSSFRNVVFSVCRNPDDGQSPEP